MSETTHKSLMRNLGEFVGHITRAFKQQAEPDHESHEVKRTVDEHKEGHVTFRRTTIDEVEYRNDQT